MQNINIQKYINSIKYNPIINQKLVIIESIISQAYNIQNQVLAIISHIFLWYMKYKRYIVVKKSTCKI